MPRQTSGLHYRSKSTKPKPNGFPLFVRLHGSEDEVIGQQRLERPALGLHKIHAQITNKHVVHAKATYWAFVWSNGYTEEYFLKADGDGIPIHAETTCILELQVLVTDLNGPFMFTDNFQQPPI